MISFYSKIMFTFKDEQVEVNKANKEYWLAWSQNFKQDAWLTRLCKRESESGSVE